MNIKEQKLYFIKVAGILKPITYFKGGWFNGWEVKAGYRISIKGQRATLTMEYLKTLNDFDTATIQEIKVYQNET